MKLTSTQRRVVDYLIREGQKTRGRWIHSFPIWVHARTVDSLVRQDILERKCTPIPRSKWTRRKNCVGEYNISFRPRRDVLRFMSTASAT